MHKRVKRPLDRAELLTRLIRARLSKTSKKWRRVHAFVDPFIIAGSCCTPETNQPIIVEWTRPETAEILKTRVVDLRDNHTGPVFIYADTLVPLDDALVLASVCDALFFASWFYGNVKVPKGWPRNAYQL